VLIFSRRGQVRVRARVAQFYVDGWSHSISVSFVSEMT